MGKETETGLESAHEALIRDRLRSALDLAREQLAEIEHTPRDIGDQMSGIDEPIIVPWELSSAREEQVRQRVAEVEAALERLSLGIYGTCESCGRPIGIDRLEALPETRLCIECAREQQAG